MKTVKTSDPTLEQRCPACAGLFTISSANRRKKVQCPQCRAVVTLTEPAELNGTPAKDGLAVPDWIARCELLQARIEALEAQVEALMVSPRTQGLLLPERLQELRTGSRERRPPDEPTESPDRPALTNGEPSHEVFRTEPHAAGMVPRAVFGRSFQPPVAEIGLVVPAGDGAAQRVAQTLTEILARAGWKVRGVAEDKALADGPRGLTFAAAPTLPLQQVTGTLNALREAGFAANFQIDPERGASEALLIVGPGTGSEKKGG